MINNFDRSGLVHFFYLTTVSRPMCLANIVVCVSVNKIPFSNFFSRVYLFCMLLVFSLPKLSDNFKLSIVYTLPLLQTSLTISVYATVTIAICGWLYIRPVAQSTEQSTTTITNNIEKSNR